MGPAGPATVAAAVAASERGEAGSGCSPKHKPPLRGAHLTAAAVDRSWQLRAAADASYGGRLAPLVGELQAAFVALVCGQDGQALERWKRLVAAWCAADDIAAQDPALYDRFIDALCGQLVALPTDWFQDTISGDSFLRRCITDAVGVLVESGQAELLHSADRVSRLVARRFGWQPQLALVEGDNAPVVVDPSDVW